MGSGKSHLASVLGSLAGKRVDTGAFLPVLEKLRDSDVKLKFKQELENDGKFLVIPLSGNASIDLSQQLLIGLKRTLDGENLKVTLDTSYALAVETIDRWYNEFPETHKALVRLIDRSDYQSIKHFRDSLSNFDKDALTLFEALYPQLTAGSEFNAYIGDVSDIYEDACQKLTQEYGFRGILGHL